MQGWRCKVVSTNLLVIGCAAPPVIQLPEFIRLCRTRGWSPSIILSPTASTWFDRGRLSEEVGCPVRVEPRTPSEPKKDATPIDAAVLAPATFNTINKWAAGIADTLALATLAELLGSGVPTLVAPCAKPTLRRHPAFRASIVRLTDLGVAFMDLPEVRNPVGLLEFDWKPLMCHPVLAKPGG